MTPDRDLLWITLGAILAFAALAVFSPRVLFFLGKTRGLKRPPRGAVTIFRIWFTLLTAGAIWLLLAGSHGLLTRPGTR